MVLAVWRETLSHRDGWFYADQSGESEQERRENRESVSVSRCKQYLVCLREGSEGAVKAD